MADRPENSEASRRRQRQAEALRANLKKRRERARKTEAAGERPAPDVPDAAEPE